MSITKKGRNRAITESENPESLEDSAVPQNRIRNLRVEIVIAFMNANLQRSISLTELAGVANLSPSHLCRLFKTQTGISPGEYLRRLRMEKARHLLSTSVLSVKQIMAVAGYNSKSHFVRHFRRSFGLTPSEYRRTVST
jgi:AraC family transcriptional regulator